MDIKIVALSPELVDDYLYFFDNMVFTENPDWSKCYCYSFHFTGPDEQWNKKDNRATVTKLIKEGRMKGYLAYSDNTPVGWVNVNNRNNYQRLSTEYKLDINPDKEILSIVCFLISPKFRAKGIAKKLLERIIEDNTGSEFDILEAYPGKGRLSCERNYKGPLNLYESNGFRISNEYDNYFIVRKKLK